MSFENKATKTELREAAELFARMLAGESVRAIVASTPAHLTLSIVQTRIVFIGRQLLWFLKERVRHSRIGLAGYQEHRAAYECALSAYLAWLEPAPEEAPIAWLVEKGKGDLVSLPDRALHIMWQMGVYDKAGLIAAVKAGRVTLDIPNLGEKAYQAIIAFSQAD